MKKIPFLLLLVVLIAGGAFLLKDRFFPKQQIVLTPGGLPVRIGLSMDALKELRWVKDRDLMTENAKVFGASVVTLVADGDDKTQISQIQNFITQKVDAIIIVAHNGKALSKVVAEAKAAGIKVIAYDRMIMDADLDMYISFDSEKVGMYAAQYVLAAVPKSVTMPKVAFIGGAETDNNAFLVKQGAMSVLDPLIKNGQAKLVLSKFTKDWNPDIAYSNLKNYLAGGGKVDAVVASNDGTAFGSIQALKEYGLDGRVPVSGQDAELAAIKRLVQGTQTVSSYKPIRLLAEKAVEVAIDLAAGKTPVTTGTLNNGQIDVPSFLIDPVPVIRSNIEDTVIKDGFYTTQEVFGSSK